MKTDCTLLQNIQFCANSFKSSIRGDQDNCYIKPPLANSDHDTVQLIPVYRTLLKSCKPVNKVVRLWAFGENWDFKGLFFVYGLKVLYDSDIDKHNEIRTAYAKFCIDYVIPVYETLFK